MTSDEENTEARFSECCNAPLLEYKSICSKCKEYSGSICACYPEHCLVPEHDECWCCPRIEVVDGSTITVHNERH